jgi:hypothetical protein
MVLLGFLFRDENIEAYGQDGYHSSEGWKEENAVRIINFEIEKRGAAYAAAASE